MAVQFIIHIKMQINRINRPIKAWAVTKEDLYLKSKEWADMSLARRPAGVRKALCERERCLSPPHCLRFLLSQTLFGGKKGEPEWGDGGKKRITEKTDVVSGERRKQRLEDKEVKQQGCARLSLPPTRCHNSNSSVSCPAYRHAHTYTHTHRSFTRGERVPQSQISHSSQLGGQDTGRVNLIREKIRPWQTECLLLWPWSACKFKAKFNRCYTVAAQYPWYDTP